MRVDGQVNSDRDALAAEAAKNARPVPAAVAPYYVVRPQVFRRVLFAGFQCGRVPYHFRGVTKMLSARLPHQDQCGGDSKRRPDGG